MEIIGQRNMAEEFSVTVNAVVKMEDRGLPILRKGLGGNVYDSKAAWAWRIEDAIRDAIGSTNTADVKLLTIRRAMAETRTAEIELAKLEGSLADVGMIRRGLDGVIVNQRTILLSLPSQIGRDIDEPELRARTVAIVDRRVREALEALSWYDPIIEPSDGASDDVDPVEPAPESPVRKPARRKRAGK